MTGGVMSEYAACREQAVACIVELQRQDLTEERREMLEFMARQWLTLAVEHAIFEGVDFAEIETLSRRPH